MRYAQARILQIDLAIAVKKGDTPTALELVRQGADVRTPVSKDGTTILHLIAVGPYTPAILIDEVIKNGAVVDAIDMRGNTPFLSAAFHLHAITAKRLLKAGADWSLQNKFGYTAVDIAYVRSNWKLKKLLYKYRVKYSEARHPSENTHQKHRTRAGASSPHA